MYGSAGRSMCCYTDKNSWKRTATLLYSLGFEDKKEKHTTKAEMGHFKKANTTPKRKLMEFTGFKEGQVKEGEVLTAEFFRP